MEFISTNLNYDVPVRYGIMAFLIIIHPITWLAGLLSWPSTLTLQNNI